MVPRQMQKSAARFLLPKTHEEVWYRGEKYVEERKVKVIKGDEKEVEAQVLGTSHYLVKLKFAGGGLSKGCNCPYAKDSLARHPACKHMVATAIVWDKTRNIPRPTKEEVESCTIAPPAISRREIDQMYHNPLHADLEKLRILADETALGGKPRPHSRLPNMPNITTNQEQSLTTKEIKMALGEIKKWTRYRLYDPYFCSGEMVTAFCEVARIITQRLTVTPPLTAAQILREAQKFHYTLIIELIDDSNGLHEFTEAHLDQIYNQLKNAMVRKEDKEAFGKKLKEFDDHRNDY